VKNWESSPFFYDLSSILNKEQNTAVLILKGEKNITLKFISKGD